MGSYKTVITLVKSEYSNTRASCIIVGCCSIVNIYSTTGNTANSYLNRYGTGMCTTNCIKEQVDSITWCYECSSVTIVAITGVSFNVVKDQCVMWTNVYLRLTHVSIECDCRRFLCLEKSSNCNGKILLYMISVYKYIYATYVFHFS